MVIYSHPSYRSIRFVFLSSILPAVRMRSPSSRSPRYFPWNPRPASKISSLTHPNPAVCNAMIAEKIMPRLLGWDLRGGHYVRWRLLLSYLHASALRVRSLAGQMPATVHSTEESPAHPNRKSFGRMQMPKPKSKFSQQYCSNRPRAICIPNSIDPPARKEYNTILPGLHETPYIYMVAFVWGRRSGMNY
jgi:hypothetical protein